MKNNYIIEFKQITGMILYISHIDPYCTNGLKKNAYVFTNKKTALYYAKYFIKYVLCTECEGYNIIKL